jgi:hypothetical protein
MGDGERECGEWEKREEEKERLAGTGGKREKRGIGKIGESEKGEIFRRDM